MALQFSARTDIGLARDQNEDNFLIDRKLQLFIVCDGMGGHNSGEVASATAVNVVRETLLKQRQTLTNYERGESSATERDVRALLTEAVQTANARIHERGMASPAQRGMGTTLCLLLIIGSRGFYAHVGDSRLYRMRGTRFEQLTMDLSFYNESLQIQPELAQELLDDRFKNAITRALGPTATVAVDTEDFLLKSGDRFMLCSDGLSGYLDEDEGSLERLMTIADLDEAAQAMILYANDQGGKDNTTTVLIEVGDEVGEARDAPKAFLALRGFPLLRHLKDAELQTLIALTDERCFEPGHKLWAEGDETDGLYVVVEGQLVISRMNTLISRIGPGQYVGSITVMDGGRRSAAAFADRGGPVTCLVLSRDKFNELLLNQPALGIKLLWGIARSLASRLRNATGRVVSSAPASPEFLHGDVKFKGGLQPGWKPAPGAPAIPVEDDPAHRAKASTKPTPKPAPKTASKTASKTGSIGDRAKPLTSGAGGDKKKRIKKPKQRATAPMRPIAPQPERSGSDSPEPSATVSEAYLEPVVPQPMTPAEPRPDATTLPSIPAPAAPEELRADVSEHVDSPVIPTEAQAPEPKPEGDQLVGDAATSATTPDVPPTQPEPPAEPDSDPAPAVAAPAAQKDAPVSQDDSDAAPKAKDSAAEAQFVPTIGDIFGTTSSSGRGSQRRRHQRRGLRPRRGSAKGRSD